MMQLDVVVYFLAYLNLLLGRYFPALDVEVEKDVGLASDGRHVVDKVRDGHVVFQHDLQGQLKQLHFARLDHLVPVDLRGQAQHRVRVQPVARLDRVQSVGDDLLDVQQAKCHSKHSEMCKHFWRVKFLQSRFLPLKKSEAPVGS